MNKNTIIAFVLIFLILGGFMWWQQPSAEQRAEDERKHDSAYKAMILQDSLLKVQAQLPAADSLLATAGNDSLKAIAQEAQKREAGWFSNAIQGNTDTIGIQNEVFTLKFLSKGAKLYSATLNNEYLTYDKTPLSLIAEGKLNLNLILEMANFQGAVETKNLYFKTFVNNKEALPQVYKVKGKDSLKLSFRAYANNANPELTVDTTRYIEFYYTVKGNKYDIGYSVSFNNVKDYIANKTFFDLQFGNELQKAEKNAKNERLASAIYYKTTTDEVDDFGTNKDIFNEKDVIKVPLKWMSFKQQFFSTTLIADKQFENAEIAVGTDIAKNSHYLCDMSATLALPYTAADKYNVDMKLYVGPNKYNILKHYNMDLERQIPLGWGFFLLQWINRFAVLPVFNFLEQFNWNYGIIILVLTILVKIVLFPIAMKSYKSSAKMKVLQPRVKEIADKYPKTEQAMEKQKATMALYKKAGANPMSGCIPMLLQFPILVAMFRFFPSSIELRQQPFLWADDLSTYDSIANLPFNIPFYGDHISLFCILMAVANMLYTIQNMKSSAQNNSIPGMKMMMYFMPIMLLFMFNSFSAGLNYYYFISTLITFFQMWLVQRTIDPAKIEAKIRENSAKPQKQSGFMKRLEDMQRQNQQMAEQRQKGKRR